MMSDHIANCFTIPVLMLMIRDLEFQQAECRAAGVEDSEINNQLIMLRNVLGDKQ